MPGHSNQTDGRSQIDEELGGFRLGPTGIASSGARRGQVMGSEDEGRLAMPSQAGSEGGDSDGPEGLDDGEDVEVGGGGVFNGGGVGSSSRRGGETRREGPGLQSRVG